MKIETIDLFFSFNDTNVLNGINFCSNPGELIALMGPNGAGKTTFIRCLLGFLKPTKGRVLLNDKPINLYSRKELSKEIAYIPQSYNPAFNHTVLDTVLMGLNSKIGLLKTPGAEEETKALKTLDELGLLPLANRGIMKISGGEKQLVLLARALVQDAHILIMDEPTSSLDFGNSYKVMRKVKELSQKDYTIIFSTHDPNLALRFATRIVGLKNGNIISDTQSDCITGQLISDLYGVDVEICSNCRGVSMK